MRLIVAGCSGSFAGPHSPASCYLVQSVHQGRTWTLALDLGSGALGTLQQHLDPLDLDAVLLSHLHPDHCVDLLGLYVYRHYLPSGSPTGHLPVYGPAGTAERLSLMYEGLPDGGMETTFDYRTLRDGMSFHIGPFLVTSLLMNHPVQAFGLRVEADGAVLAYTGDTDTCDNLQPLMSGADLVLADCAFIDGRDDTRNIHLTGSRAAQAAVRAGGVGRLVLTHMPAWNDTEVCRAQAQAVPGAPEVSTAVPNDMVEL